MTTTTNPNPKTSPSSSPNATPATDHVSTATEACARTTNEAMKAVKSGFDAWTDASRTMFDAYANAFTKGAAAMPFFGAQKNEQAGAFASPASAFEQMTKVMNGLVDANARFATECTALAVDAFRANARIVERTGEVVLNQWSTAGRTAGKTPQSPMPMFDSARAIFDEASTFAKSAADRAMAMNGEHAKSVATIVDRMMTQSCCTPNGACRTA